MIGLRGRSSLAWVAVVVAVFATVAGCARPPAPHGPPPAVGAMVPAASCRADGAAIREQADALVRTGLRETGFHTVFVDCAGAGRRAYTDDAALSGYLAERGLTLDFPDAAERSAAVDIAAASDARVRTDLTRRVMLAQPLIVASDIGALPPATLDVLNHREVVEIARDRREAPGAQVLDDPGMYSRAIGEQGLLVSLTNSTPATRDLAVRVADLGLAGDDLVPARDVWTGRRIRAADGVLTIAVPARDTALLRIG
ncbi:hypothetical protein [Gordonia sp. (in: high G+C Gram-positive bacteria)]|uniref:hypothetical protein n=1 Tax=Gordonia sp. (in: high G+C Gram-positive bacteria) TaxID=84139 RepID=UPI003C746578